MGRQKKGFNVRAREQHDGQLNRQEEVNQLQGKVVLDKKGQEQTSNGGGGEDTNQLVLPSAKRTLKKYKNPNEKVKILSKKRRKILQRVVDEKKKKAERGDLLERLKQVQIPAGQLEQMTSISSIQTKGVKRQMAEEAVRRELASQGVRVQEDKVKEVLGNPAKKMKIKKVLLPKPEAPKRDDVLGFEESSSEEEEDTEEESDAEITEEEKEEAPPSPVHVPKKVVPEVPKPVQTVSSEPKTFVPVHRTPEMQALREKLPIIAEEQAIMEAIQENPVVILAGETGSGKTTQVPQFLYEAGYTRGGKLIGVTEPRRVAAMAMANRVGEELNDKTLASFQIRFEGNVTEETKIKFMTDGILLREMAKDFRLRKYSAIIIDEAHERSVFTDILIGNLSRIVPMRAKDEENGPLKLIIMSATLRVEDFTENRKLFKELPPVIKVESRQFESTCHFQRETPEDYVLAALKKTCKIHRELPEGGILVFLTGQQEVNQMVRKLRKLFPAKQDQEKKGKLKNKDKKEEDDNETVEKAMQDAFKKSRKKKSKVEKMIEQNKVVVPTVNLDNFNTIPLDDTETDAAKDMEDEEDDLDLTGDEKIMEALSSKYGAAQAMWTLPLYSLMNSEKQSKIFAPVPEGHRLCVVATNIAETSLTIPGIKYVVDCGKVKTKFYDKLTGVSTFQVRSFKSQRLNPILLGCCVIGCFNGEK